MSGNFDLDIRNYTIKDIEKLFNIKPSINYKPSDIELIEYRLREQLTNSGSINSFYKADLITFLNDAKEWLMIEKCKDSKRTPTVVPSNVKLDSIEYINSDVDISRQGDLINKPPTQFVHTYNNDFYAGTLNPLNNRTLTKCLSIDSKFRDNFYTTQGSDFTVQLPSKINKVVSMQLSAVEFPIVFYSISNAFGNNFFYIQSVMDVSSSLQPIVHRDISSQIIVIPDGNYTASDLISYINTTIIQTIKDPTGAFGVFSDTHIPVNMDDPLSFIEFQLDVTPSGSGTGHVIAQCTDFAASLNIYPTITLDFSLDINGNPDTTDIRSKFGWVMGFTKSKYTGETYYVSESLCNPMGTKYIYLAIDDFHNNVNDHFISAFNQSAINSNVLARISFRGDNYYSLVASDNMNMITEARRYFGPVDIQKLRIRLYDDFGRIIQMNNIDFSLCLNFKVIYDL